MLSLRLPLVSSALALLAAGAPLAAQVADAPAVDATTLLRELHKLRDTQTTQAKQARQTALQQIAPAASSPERAVAVWEEAVRAVQFDGAPKENAGFREWKEKEGEALSGPLARNAARLYFMWLSLTLQRDGGAKVKELLPQVIAYTKELLADQAAAEALEDSIKHEKETAPAGRRPGPQQPARKATDDQVKKMHDQILRRAIGSSPVVQWLKLTDFVSPEKWEKQPGDFDGIYNQIILPELREQHDPHVLDYWDLKLKKEADLATKTKLAFEIEKYNSQRRPSLLWARAEDILAIGQKNRAIGEMFAIIRAVPQHPEAAGWVTRLESILAPAAPVSAADVPSAGAAPLPGSAPAAPGVVK